MLNWKSSREAVLVTRIGGMKPPLLLSRPRKKGVLAERIPTPTNPSRSPYFASMAKGEENRLTTPIRTYVPDDDKITSTMTTLGGRDGFHL